MAEQEGRWVTMNGAKVFINSKGDAILGLGNSEYRQPQDFGKPGKYLLYRAGSTDTLRGVVSFAYQKDLADAYAKLPQHKEFGTKAYEVVVNNPLVIESETSMGATQEAHMKLFGKSFDNSKANAQRAADKRIGTEMAKRGYDGLMLRILYSKGEHSGYEVLVPSKFKKNIKEL